jgi:hypothetical protein
MSRKSLLKEKMLATIANHDGEVLLRADFADMASPSQISRILKKLVEEGMLIRLGYGTYAKTKISPINGKPIPRAQLAELAQETLLRLEVPVQLGRAQRAYAEGRTTQIPVHIAFDTGPRRISRKLSIGLNRVRYENHYTA